MGQWASMLIKLDYSLFIWCLEKEAKEYREEIKVGAV